MASETELGATPSYPATAVSSMCVTPSRLSQLNLAGTTGGATGPPQLLHDRLVERLNLSQVSIIVRLGLLVLPSPVHGILEHGVRSNAVHPVDVVKHSACQQLVVLEGIELGQ